MLQNDYKKTTFLKKALDTADSRIFVNSTAKFLALNITVFGLKVVLVAAGCSTITTVTVRKVKNLREKREYTLENDGLEKFRKMYSKPRQLS